MQGFQKLIISTDFNQGLQEPIVTASEIFFLFLRVGPFPFWGYHSKGIITDIYTALQHTCTTSKPLDVKKEDTLYMVRPRM